MTATDPTGGYEAVRNPQPCEHEWVVADWHVCPAVARVDNQHAHYSWPVCRKCGEGSVLR